MKKELTSFASRAWQTMTGRVYGKPRPSHTKLPFKLTMALSSVAFLAISCTQEPQTTVPSETLTVPKQVGSLISGSVTTAVITNAKPKIITDPSSALVYEEEELVINAKVTDINGKIYPASSLEWKNLNPDILKIVALENNGYRARVKVMNNSIGNGRGGQLLVRSKDNASIVSDPILIAYPILQFLTNRVQDSDIFFPAKQWDLYSTNIPAGYNNTNVAGFTPTEIANTYSNITAPMIVKEPFVGYWEIGRPLVPTRGRGESGTVVAATRRGGYALLTIRSENPGKLIKDMVIKAPAQSIFNEWASTGTITARVANGQNDSGGLRAQEVTPGWVCESAAGVTASEISFKSSASIQPIVSTSPSVINGRANVEITLGARIPLSMSINASVGLGLVQEWKCADKKNESKIDIPVGGVFSGFAISGELKIAPIVKVAIAAKTTALAAGVSINATPMIYGKFTVGDDGFQGGEFKVDVEKREFKTTQYTLRPPAGSAEIKVSVGAEGKGGLSLGGKASSDFRQFIDKLPSNPVTDAGRQLTKFLTYFNVFKVFSGVEGKVLWASEGLLKAEKKNLSTINLSLTFETAFENDQVNSLLAFMKSYGFNSNKVVAMKALTQTIELDKAYTGLKSSDVRFDGKSVSAGGTIKIRKNDSTVTLTTAFEFPSSFVLPLPMKGLVEIEGVGKFNLTANGMVLSGKIPGSVCAKLQTPKKGFIWPYNKLGEAVETASYLGQYMFTCSDEPGNGEPAPNDPSWCNTIEPTLGSAMQKLGDPTGVVCVFPYSTRLKIRNVTYHFKFGQDYNDWYRDGSRPITFPSTPILNHANSKLGPDSDSFRMEEWEIPIYKGEPVTFIKDNLGETRAVCTDNVSKNKGDFSQIQVSGEPVKVWYTSTYSRYLLPLSIGTFFESDSETSDDDGKGTYVYYSQAPSGERCVRNGKPVNSFFAPGYVRRMHFWFQRN
jgi:hypothetical protein